MDLNQLQSNIFGVAHALNSQWQETKKVNPGIAQQLGSVGGLIDKLQPLVQQWEQMGQQFIQGASPGQSLSPQAPAQAPSPAGGSTGKISPDAKPIVAWISGSCKFAQTPSPIPPDPQPQPAAPAPAPAPAPTDYYTELHRRGAEERKRKLEQEKLNQEKWVQQNGPGQPFAGPKARVETTNLVISAEDDPKYHGPQGQQALEADGFPEQVDVTVHYETEYEPPSGDGWNEPRSDGGFIAYVHHVVTSDGRDITDYIPERAMEEITKDLEEGAADQWQAHADQERYDDERDRMACRGKGKFNFAKKKKKKKHSSCASCGGWIGHWMTACPDCGKSSTPAPEAGQEGNGGGGGGTTPTAATAATFKKAGSALSLPEVMRYVQQNGIDVSPEQVKATLAKLRYSGDLNWMVPEDLVQMIKSPKPYSPSLSQRDLMRYPSGGIPGRENHAEDDRSDPAYMERTLNWNPKA